MAQFTKTETTTRGVVVTAVLDTVTDSITYTATAPNGATATTTAPAAEAGNASANVSSIFSQLQTGGLTTSPGNLPTVLSSIQTDLANDAAIAARADAPAPATVPIPVAPANNPNPTPAPSIPPIENPAPVDTTDPELSAYPPNPVDVAREQALISDAEAYPPNPVETLARERAIISDNEAYPPNPQILESDLAVYPANPVTNGLQGATKAAQSKATRQDLASLGQKDDWRVKLSLAPGSNYLYNVGSDAEAGILAPLRNTSGVVFPYTPSITVSYAAHYDNSTLTHSNYKIFQYGSSSVDTITITCDFTAQDTFEANYLLAVIHFFRSATKMFYGQDQTPKPGTPPPLCFLTGLGDFQFQQHPLAITGFNYTLPTDVDYIRAGKASSGAGVNTSPQVPKSPFGDVASLVRAVAAGLGALGGKAPPPNFNATSTVGLQSTSGATYVPTKMSLTITAIPIVTRNDISNNFSLRDYASGKLIRKGIW